MTTQNPYRRRSKIDSKKSLEILRYFCLDLTATTTGKIVGIERKTINNWYNYFREVVYWYSNREVKEVLNGVIEMDESCFGATRVKGKRGRGTASLGCSLPLTGWEWIWLDAQRAVEHRSTFLVEISEILIHGILLGMLFLGMWSYLIPSINIWYQHPDKKQKVLLGLSDLILGIGCWIVVLCYWSQYLAERSWILGFSSCMFFLPLFLAKFFHLLEK